MPLFGIGLHVLIALYFGIHAIRTGQNLFWLMILFAFPLLGSIVYLFAIYLPELRGSAGAQRARRAVGRAMNPGRTLREARESFDRTPTVAARLRLADALYASGDAASALAHYREAAQGPFASDVVILLGLARAQFACGEFPASCATLDKLFELDPAQRQSPDASLLHARALVEAGSSAAEIRAAFEAALGPAKDAEARCRYADWLVGQDEADRDKALALYREIVKDSAFWHRHAHGINREWLSRAKAATR
jgi:hypothetical protein